MSMTGLFAVILSVYALVFLHSSRLVPDSNVQFSNEISKNADQKQPPAGLTKQDLMFRIVHGNTKIPVVVWPNVEYGAETAASLHLEENGIQESLYLKLSNDFDDFDPNVVWIADGGNSYYNEDDDSEADFCKEFTKRVQHAMKQREKLGLPLEWPIFIIDWSDYGQELECQALEEMLGIEYVKYARRATVYGRRWNDTSQWVDLGRINPESGVFFHHSPLAVRTDTVETLSNVLHKEHNMTLASSIESLERSIDVAHFWPLDLVGVSNTDDAKLRQRVSQIVAKVGKTHGWNVYVALAGNASSTGRRKVQAAYIETMLESKIVVVSQRDEWEDHYRLFEALVSGAMVMTDKMLALPQGLENGMSVVEYQSAHDLCYQLLYYMQHSEERLEIARRGREVAMRQHRAWHRMEEIVFGKILSDCSGAKPGSSCPWIVHANEVGEKIQ